ncbi:GerAB/ArcD/ProY family transporter [Bacillus sp. JCM 19034]|uniref:GerAB/ArcD/ProY family transporter n=1 Tax=Bacillus sp. JCM 19034 TaxID=1481928 RepID=UPI0007830075|nr:GerAB/ArcD/ProY family transporter [Bacillus sp. JCM 19034]
MKRSKEIVSDHQMSFIFLCYMIGSALVNIPSPLIGNAGNAAWISLILASVISLGLLYVIFYLNKVYKGKTFVEYSREIYGKWLSHIFHILLFFLLLIMISNIILDVGMFLHNTVMRETPLYIFQVFILFVAALTVFCGFEVIGRMFTMLLLFVLLVLGLFLVTIIPAIEPEYVLPLIPEGWGAVFQGVYFVYGFPYSEVIFVCYFAPFFSTKRSRYAKTGYDHCSHRYDGASTHNSNHFDHGIRPYWS